MFPIPINGNSREFSLSSLQSRFQSYNIFGGFNHGCLTVSYTANFLRHTTQQIQNFAMVLEAKDINNATKLLETDLIIAYGLSQIHQYVADDGYRFMGPTGSGKSNVSDIHTFFFGISPGLKIIDTITNQPGRRAGSRLESCTTEVRAVRLSNHPVHGDRLVLVDTPGFDDTNKSDLEILQMVSNWLQKV